MAGTYAPASHVAPETAKVGSAVIEGLSPGQVYVALNDARVPTNVLLPTALTPDGYPTAMTGFPTGTGAVT